VVLNVTGEKLKYGNTRCRGERFSHVTRNLRKLKSIHIWQSWGIQSA